MIDIVTKRRLGRTLSAQLYSQIVTITCQLALVPLLLWAWGAERYGAWLVLTAVPTFLTFSDFGFTFVAKNEMVISVSAGDRLKALATFQSIFILLSIVSPIVALGSAVFIFSVSPDSLLSIHGLPTDRSRWILMAFIANVLSYQYFLLICAGIRSENRPATESMWAATSRLMESVVFGIGAICTTDLLIAALLGLVSRIVFIILAYAYLKRYSPWLSFGSSVATRAEISRLAHPAFAYMLVPIGQALLIQGPVIALAKLAGPMAVVTFSTSRTLARVGTAATNMFNNTFIAEYSAMAGSGKRARFRSIRHIHLAVSSVLIVLYIGGLLLSSKIIMNIFTHGKIEIIHPFFFVMTLAVAAEMFWSAQFTSISAVNRHKFVTYSLAAFSIIGILFCYALIPKYGILGAAISLMAVHIIMVFVCAWETGKLSRSKEFYVAKAGQHT